MNAKIVNSMLRRSTRAAACILVAYFLLLPGLACSDSLANPSASTRIDYGMPERLGRQVAPTPSAPWSPPDLRGYTSLLKSAEPSAIDPQKRYELVELIDLAERLNPETRVRGSGTPGRDWGWIGRKRILSGAHIVGAWGLPE